MKRSEPERASPASTGVQVTELRKDAELAVAREIAALVRGKGGIVLGLATGDTPAGVYRELARMRAEEGLDCGAVETFNLDEFVGLPPGHPRSFAESTRERVLLPLGIAAERARVPAATGDALRDQRTCLEYERAIEAAGGIDLLLLGIGRNGHVAFNEPGSPPTSRTRVVDLHPWTREDAAASFGGLELVPERAVTIGVATILDARRIRVLAFGERKAEIVRAALEGPVAVEVPATLLRGHPDLVVRLDRAAASACARATAR